MEAPSDRSSAKGRIGSAVSGLPYLRGVFSGQWAGLERGSFRSGFVFFGGFPFHLGRGFHLGLRRTGGLIPGGVG